MPVQEWPEADQAAWTAAMQPATTAADDCAVSAHWSEATRRMVRGGYGRWLTWLGEKDQLDGKPPAARVTTERLSNYIAALRKEIGEFTVAVRVEQLGNAMRVLAPKQHWQWIQRIADQIRASARADRKRQHEPPGSSEDDAASASRPTPSNRCLPLREWPALDQTAWAAALQPGDALDPGGVASGWAAATQTMVINGYGRWLTWLIAAGLCDPLMAPPARVTRERLRTYAKELQASVASFTVAARIEQLGNAIRAMAPDQDWQWIQRAADRLRAEAVPVRDKRRRLQSPEQLVALGAELMVQADDPGTGSPADRATAHRDGLILALLAHRPMRARNLASILCGQHLLRRGTDWWLVFPERETKTRQLIEFPFPSDLQPYLERYLETYRPVLLARGQRRGSPVAALWVSRHGTHMGSAAIGHQVRDRTKAAFGRSLSPHLFRDCLATGIAISEPAQIRLTQSLLGHTTPVTGEQHYNLAGSIEAGKRYADTIAKLRQAATAADHATAR